MATLKIFVDADACPAAVKEIVVRAAERLAVSAIFVANKDIRLPPSRHVSTVRVAMGLDVADGYIARSASAGDLAITADIPLAAALVARGAVVLDLRGTVYTEENVGEALAVRNFHHELREGGVVTGGPSSRRRSGAAGQLESADVVAASVEAARPCPRLSPAHPRGVCTSLRESFPLIPNVFMLGLYYRSLDLR